MAGPVLVTGVTGFIAKHVALALLKSGYSVRGTVRSPARAEGLRATLARHGADSAKLELVEANLRYDAGWGKAAAGCPFVLHIASPLPLIQPRDRQALVPQARGGTLRVLKAAHAAGVARVVVTSSIVAMMYWPGRPVRYTFGESDWTDPDWPPLTAYMVAKTLAERAAWDWVCENAPAGFLSTIHPGLVLGPILDGEVGTSLNVVFYMLKRAYPAIPKADYPLVDVRDVAALHVKAMTEPAAGGRRLIAAGDTWSLAQIAAALREAVPGYAGKIPTRALPDILVRAMALVDGRVRNLIPDLGYHPKADSAYVTELLGHTNRPAREALVDTAQAMIDQGLV